MKKYLFHLFFILCFFLTADAAENDRNAPSVNAGWREVFGSDSQFNIDWQPEGMHFLVPHTQFRVEDIASASNGKALVIEAKCSAGARVIAPRKVDWKKTPVLRWRWRLVRPVVLQKGRQEPDDQPGVIYIGDGTLSSMRCVAYRWEKKRAIGECKRESYAAGRIDANLQCVANDSTPLNEWHIEEHHIVNDFIAAFGTPPKERFVLCVGANSHHSKSDTRLEIDFIEFIPERSAADE